MALREAVEAIRRAIADVIEALGSEPPRVEVAFDASDIEAQLTTHRSGLFLGIYDEASAEAALERLGLLATMRERLGVPVRIRIAAEESILRAYRTDRPEGPGSLVLEMKARLVRAAPPALEKLGFPEGDILAVDWILLQDPGRPFPPGQRALPGQAHPGLGLGRHFGRVLREAATRLRAIAVIGIPQSYNTAVLYRRASVFGNPVAEGRFQALVRDLRALGLGLAEATAAVHEGRVRDATFDEPLRWVGEEMVMPLAAPVRAYLEDPRYVDAAARVLLGTRFVVT